MRTSEDDLRCRLICRKLLEESEFTLQHIPSFLPSSKQLFVKPNLPKQPLTAVAIEDQENPSSSNHNLPQLTEKETIFCSG